MKTLFKNGQRYIITNQLCEAIYKGQLVFDFPEEYYKNNPKRKNRISPEQVKKYMNDIGTDYYSLYKRCVKYYVEKFCGHSDFQKMITEFTEYAEPDGSYDKELEDFKLRSIKARFLGAMHDALIYDTTVLGTVLQHVRRRIPKDRYLTIPNLSRETIYSISDFIKSSPEFMQFLRNSIRKSVDGRIEKYKQENQQKLKADNNNQQSNDTNNGMNENLCKKGVIIVEAPDDINSRKNDTQNNTPKNVNPLSVNPMSDNQSDDDQPSDNKPGDNPTDSKLTNNEKNNEKTVVPDSDKIDELVGHMLDYSEDISDFINDGFDTDELQYDKISDKQNDKDEQNDKDDKDDKDEQNEQDTNKLSEIPKFLNNDAYEINELIVSCLQNIKNDNKNKMGNNDSFTEEYNFMNDTYNEIIDKIQNGYKNIVSNYLVVKDLNPNWIDNLIHIDDKSINQNIPNNVVINTLYNSLFGKKNKSVNESSGFNIFEADENTSKEKWTQFKNLFKPSEIVDKAFSIYKTIKLLNPIEINDYYTVENELSNYETITEENKDSIILSFASIFSIPNDDKIDKKHQKNDINSVYLEYILLRIVQDKLLDEFGIMFKKMGHNDREKLEKMIKNRMKESKKNKQNEFDIDDIRLKKFESHFKRKPKSSIDIEGYKNAASNITEYRYEMHVAIKYVKERLRKYGMTRILDYTIRPVTKSEYRDLLKSQDIKRGSITDAMYYSFLTDIAKDYPRDESKNKNKRIDSNNKILDTIHKIVPKEKDDQISANKLSTSVLFDLLIMSDANMQDFVAGFKENSNFQDRFGISSTTYGEEGEGNRVITLPIIGKRCNNDCIGVFRIKNIFARTRNVADSIFKSDFMRTIMNDIKR